MVILGDVDFALACPPMDLNTWNLCRKREDSLDIRIYFVIHDAYVSQMAFRALEFVKEICGEYFVSMSNNYVQPISIQDYYIVFTFNVIFSCCMVLHEIKIVK